MNIVFDIDNTITNETEFILKNAPTFLKRKYGIDVKIVNPNGCDISEIYGLYDIFKSMDNTLTEEELNLKCKRVNSFYNKKKFIKYIFYPLKEDAVKIIKDLKAKGYKINFVSLRGIKNKENENFKDIFVRKVVVSILTRLQLFAINKIKYDKLFLVENAIDKKTIIKDLKAAMVFDDSVEVINSLNDVNTIPICVEAPHNIIVDFDNERVMKIPLKYDLVMNVVDDVEKKAILTKEKNKKRKLNNRKREIKNLKLYQKWSSELFYKLIRTAGKRKIIKLFKPLIIGKDNLPKEKGPNVFVGNHRNIKDPIITVALLKNPTHFAALKRMFEYNENFFGKVGKNFGTVVTTLFVKSMGALPIARPHEDDYRLVNLQTFKYFMEYLHYNSAVAIYPEGTLNRNPERDGNILPLKSNRAFKIAENGKGIIRPIAVVWVPKEVDIENRVVIAFLKPIYTHGLKADEIAEKWTYSVNNAIKSINKIIEELEKIKKEEYNIEGTKKIKRLSKNIQRL